MNPAKGFLVEGKPFCCVCAEVAANESGYPHLFYLTNKLVDMNPNERCSCGRLPNDMDCLRASVRIVKMFEEAPE